MKSMKKRVISLLLSLAMVSTLMLSGCGVGEQVRQATDDAVSAVTNILQGENIGEVGKEYATKWFKFTVESMTTTSSIPDYAATEGNILVVARITETNTSGSSQPFGTFDWFVDDDSLMDYIYPLDPLNDEMMPASFSLADGETATYDVVIEYPNNLANPFLMYIEADDQGETYSTFKIPIK